MVIIAIGVLAGIIYWVQKLLYRRWWNQAIEVSIDFAEKVVMAGESTVLTEVVENRKWLPLAALKVKFQCSRRLLFDDNINSVVTDHYYRNDLFYLGSYRRIIRRHQLQCPSRGYFAIREIDLVGADLFLSAEMVESRTCKTALHVVPRPLVTAELTAAMRQISGEAAARRHLNPDPFTFRGIREYTSFDEVKHINWKASAKTAEWKVNVHDFTVESTVSIYMNLENNQIIKQEELLEAVISTGAYAAEYFLSRRVGISIYANARDCLSQSVLAMDNCRDQGQLSSISKALARLELSERSPAFLECFAGQMMAGNDTYVIYIAAGQHREMQEFLLGFQKEHDFLWLCPGYSGQQGDIRPELHSRTRMIYCTR